MSQTYSNNQQVETSEEFLKTLKTPSCSGCSRGVAMCHHTPCIGTVDDMEKLIDAGYAKNLMMDYYYARAGVYDAFEENILHLVPAVKGVEGKRAPIGRVGTCNLLVDDKCSIHDTGLKPIQGKVACCKVERVYMENGSKKEVDERIPILITWNTERGRKLIERWAKEVGYTGEFAVPSFSELTYEDMMKLFIDITTSQLKMDHIACSNPVEEESVEVEVFEKPY